MTTILSEIQDLIDSIDSTLSDQEELIKSFIKDLINAKFNYTSDYYLRFKQYRAIKQNRYALVEKLALLDEVLSSKPLEDQATHSELIKIANSLKEKNESLVLQELTLQILNTKYFKPIPHLNDLDTPLDRFLLSSSKEYALFRKEPEKLSTHFFRHRKKDSFLVFRYLVASINISPPSDFQKHKEQVIESLLSDYSNRPPFLITEDNSPELYMFFNKYDSSLFVITISTYSVGVNLNQIIIDTDRQILLIDGSIKELDIAFMAVNLFEKELRDKVRSYGYSFNVRELPSAEKFWNHIEDSENIYELSLVLNTPNMFGGNQETKDLLKKVKEAVNIEEVEVVFRNKDGLLKVIKKTIGDYLRYIFQIGGSYRLIIGKDGIKETKTSKEDIVTIKGINLVDENGQIDPEKLSEIREKLEQIDSDRKSA